MKKLLLVLCIAFAGNIYGQLDGLNKAILESMGKKEQLFTSEIGSFGEYSLNINDYTMEKYKLPEKEYYLSVYQKYYNGFENVVPYYWMPKWIKNGGDNPSGRLIID